MKKIFGLIGVAFVISFAFQPTKAQNYSLRQVIVLNEGAFGTFVTVGAYNPLISTYSNFDTIPAAFATDVLIDNGFIYVAADSILRKYDLLTKQQVNEKIIPSMRELAVWGNQLLITLGNIQPLTHHFKVYDKSNLNFIYQLPLSGDAAEVKVWNDTAYVAVNGFGVSGNLAVIDLQHQSLNREIDLGPDGLNPETIRKEGNKIIAVSSPNYSNTAVTSYDVLTTNASTTLLGTANGCSASTLFLGNVYFGVNAESKIRVFNTQSAITWDSLQTNHIIYGIGIDSVNSRIYAGTTDYTTFGKVYVYDFYGALKDSFDVHVSPSTFAFDVVDLNSSVGSVADQTTFRIHPNPTQDMIMVYSSYSGTKEVELFNILGERVLYAPMAGYEMKLSLGNLPKGIYMLRAGSKTEKIILQ